MIEGVKAILWDIDGVKVLSEPLHVQKITAVARDPLSTGADDPVRGVIVTFEDWKELHGIGDHCIHDWLKQKNPAFPLDLDQFLATCENHYIYYAHTIKVRPGYRETFEIFAAAGIPQCAVSSGTRRQVDTNLRIAETSDRILFSVSANDVKKTKPDPEPNLACYAQMLTMKFNDRAGLFTPAHCLVIGDSGSDIKSGNAANMQTALWKLAADVPNNPAATYNLAPNAGSLISLARELTAGSWNVRPDLWRHCP